MSSPNDGGPAFPAVEVLKDGATAIAKSKGGMTLRDWFAGMAMCGLARDTLASLCADEESENSEEEKDAATGKMIDMLCEFAYIFSAAMLAHRKQEGTTDET
jgi:hypothetical protein